MFLTQGKNKSFLLPGSLGSFLLPPGGRGSPQPSELFGAKMPNNDRNTNPFSKRAHLILVYPDFTLRDELGVLFKVHRCSIRTPTLKAFFLIKCPFVSVLSFVFDHVTNRKQAKF